MKARIAAGVDRAIYRLAFGRGSAGQAESLSVDARIAGLEELARQYDVDLDGFFEPPTSSVYFDVRERGQRYGATINDVRWPSRYQPFVPDVAKRYLARELNMAAHTRIFSGGPTPRPTMILIHGYLGGENRLEQRFWPIGWLLRRGMDVALFVLPFHGPRRPRFQRPVFPNSDPRVTIEAFRQAIFDLQTLIDWLHRRGAGATAMMGMSLGGYTTALAATVIRNLTCAVPFIPLASIPDFARERGRLTGTEQEQRMQYDLLESVYRVVSPLARPRVVEHALVAAGEVDSITPRSHADLIARHLDAPLEMFYGGHILQFGRGNAFRHLGQILERATLFNAATREH